MVSCARVCRSNTSNAAKRVMLCLIWKLLLPLNHAAIKSLETAVNMAIIMKRVALSALQEPVSDDLESLG